MAMAIVALNIGMARAASAPVADTDDAIVYADSNGIKRVRHVATVWHVNDLKTARQTLVTMSAGQVYLSTKVQQEFDCRVAKVRTLSFAAHSGNMGSGDVVLADNNAGPWTPVPAEGVAKTLFNLACGKR
jgi:hypothetical protein